jgi:hypothetical protein
MYGLINDFARPIVDRIPRSFLPDYERLVQRVDQADHPSYQKEFRRFWAMNAAQLSPNFYRVYFRLLKDSKKNMPSMKDVVQTLYKSAVRRNGDRSIQFSFATKLVHIANPHLPIYDSRVAEFYFFQPPARTLETEQRIDRFLDFHAFLTFEYRRVLEQGLLAAGIQEFRRQFNPQPQRISNEKIVDSLIWACVTLLNDGSIPNKTVVYS